MFKAVRFAFGYAAHSARGLIIDIEFQSKRWAGHSKWANIRHQKASSDLERNKQFTRLSRMIRVAIAESNNNTDPGTNLKLAQAIEQCKRANMPGATVTNAIKSAAAAKSAEITAFLQVRGPKRCGMIIQIATPNVVMARNTIASINKKHGFKFDTSVAHDFVEKGILVCSPLKESANAADDAMEHAIEASVEEVNYDEETKKLQFECSPEAIWKAKKALEGLGYVVDSAVVDFFPVAYSSLSDEELEAIPKYIAKLDAMPEVLRIVDNIE